jgi:hypothetical protein
MDEIVMTLRVLIGDVTSTKYSDLDLKRLLAVSANFVLKEVDFADLYTITVNVPTITPLPVDNEFINLVSLKAGIILLESELRDMARKSVAITDGPSKIELTNVYKNTEALLKSMYDQYAYAKINHGLHGDQNSRQAIMTPTTVEVYLHEDLR